RFETGDDGRVREWIIIQDIQTIDDTVEIVPPAGKHRFQPLSEKWGEDFTCISIGNRRYDVRMIDRRLHHVHHPMPLKTCKMFHAEIQHFPEPGMLEPPLVFYVMDCIDCLHAGMRAFYTADRYCGTSLPIMAVKHIEMLFGTVHELYDCIGEKDEAFPVIDIAVQAVTIEIILIVDKKVVDAPVIKLQDACILVAPAHGSIEDNDFLHIGAVTGLYYLLIERQYDRNFHPLPCQRLGQTAGDIRQPPGFYKRSALTRCKKHTFHVTTASLF